MLYPSTTLSHLNFWLTWHRILTMKIPVQYEPPYDADFLQTKLQKKLIYETNISEWQWHTDDIAANDIMGPKAGSRGVQVQRWCCAALQRDLWDHVQEREMANEGERDRMPGRDLKERTSCNKRSWVRIKAVMSLSFSSPIYSIYFIQERLLDVFYQRKC